MASRVPSTRPAILLFVSFIRLQISNGLQTPIPESTTYVARDTASLEAKTKANSSLLAGVLYTPVKMLQQFNRYGSRSFGGITAQRP